ncbi:MAG: CsgG/HfaB family protein [Patescibacteria group bacterium]
MFRVRWLPALVLAVTMLAVALPGLAKDARPLVAVLPFDDGSIKHWWHWDDWDVGKGISDIIVNKLLDAGTFRLVEREKIASIIQEQDFGASGRVDARTAAKIGKIAGVKYVIMGKVTEFTIADKGGSLLGVTVKSSTARVAINGRIVDTTTAEILAGAEGVGEEKSSSFSVNIATFPHVAFGSAKFQESILGKATTKAVTQFCTLISQKFQAAGGGTAAAGAPTGITGKVAAVSGNKVYLNIGSAEGVAVGMVFVISNVIEEVKDPDTGEVLDVVTEDVCEITIAEVKERTSNGPITASLGGRPQKGDVAKQKY